MYTHQMGEVSTLCREAEILDTPEHPKTRLENWNALYQVGRTAALSDPSNAEVRQGLERVSG